MKSVRVLFAAFLALHFTVFTGPSAVAAEQSGQSQLQPSQREFHIKVPRAKWPDTHCTGTITFGGHASFSVFDGICKGGTNFSPTTDFPEVGTDFTFLLASGGVECQGSRVSDYFTARESEPGWSTWKSWGAFQVTGLMGDCRDATSVDVCITSSELGGAVDGQGISGFDCVSVAVPNWDVVDRECIYGGPTGDPVDMGIEKQAGNSSSLRRAIQSVGIEHRSLNNDTTTWYLYTVHTVAGGKGTQQTSLRLIELTPEVSVPDVVFNHVHVATVSSYGLRGDELPEIDEPIIGIGFFRGHGNTFVLPGSWSSLGRIPADTAEALTKRVGVNNPDNCAWYWGEKLWDDGRPGKGFDEPVRKLFDEFTNPPVPVEDVAPEDRDRWYDGIWDKITGLGDWLGKIFDALANLIADLRGLFMDLFIPKPSSWGLNGLVNQVDRAPFNYVTQVAGLGNQVVSTYSAAGGCGVIATFGDARLECGALRQIDGYNGFYYLVSGGLWLMTSVYIWNLVSTNIERGQ